MATSPDAHDSSAFPPFDPEYFASQIFWLVLIFGGMYFFLSRAILPRLSEVIEKRRDRIASDLDRAAHLNAMAEKARAERAKRLARAQEQALEFKSAARAETAAEFAAELEAYDADEKEKLAKARALIDAAEKRASQGLESAARDVTALILTKTTGVSPDPDLIGKSVESARDESVAA